jgi:hypothetical protein
MSEQATARLLQAGHETRHAGMPRGIAGGRCHIAGLLMLIASLGCGGAGRPSATPAERVLSAEALYGGLEATAVLPGRDRLARVSQS